MKLMLLSLMLVFTGVAQAQMSQKLLKMEAFEPDDTLIGSSYVWADLNADYSLKKIYFKEIPDQTINLDDIAQEKKKVGRLKKASMHFMVVKLFDVKSKDFTKSKGGNIELTIMRKLYADKKARLFKFSLQFNQHDKKWEVVSGQRIVANVNAKINMYVEDISFKKWPRLTDVQLKPLGCSNGADYLTMTGNLQRVFGLNCKKEFVEQIADQYLSSVLPNVALGETHVFFKEVTKAQKQQAVSESLKVSKMTKGSADETIIKMAVRAGHIDVVKAMINNKPELVPVGLNMSCGYLTRVSRPAWDKEASYERNPYGFKIRELLVNANNGEEDMDNCLGLMLRQRPWSPSSSTASYFDLIFDIAAKDLNTDFSSPELKKYGAEIFQEYYMRNVYNGESEARAYAIQVIEKLQGQGLEVDISEMIQAELDNMDENFRANIEKELQQIL